MFCFLRLLLLLFYTVFTGRAATWECPRSSSRLELAAKLSPLLRLSLSLFPADTLSSFPPAAAYVYVLLSSNSPEQMPMCGSSPVSPSFGRGRPVRGRFHWSVNLSLTCGAPAGPEEGRRLRRRRVRCVLCIIRTSSNLTYALQGRPRCSTSSHAGSSPKSSTSRPHMRARL